MVFSDEQNKYIESLYKLTNNSRNKAKKLFEKKYNETITARTILTKWTKAGFKRNSHGGCRNGLNEQQFKDLFYWCKSDFQEIKKISGNTCGAIVRRCREYELTLINTKKEISKKQSKDLEGTAMDEWPGQFNQNGKSRFY